MATDLHSLIREANPKALPRAEIAKLVAEGANLNAWKGSQTPLIVAVEARNAEMTRLLLSMKADPDLADPKGVTALHIAVFDGMHAVVDALLDGGAKVNARDRHGQTALFFAPDRETCMRLHRANADTTALNAKGQTALHLASHAGLNDTVLWMLETMSLPSINLTDKHGRTAVYCAARSNLKATIMLLQEHGADISIRPPGYRKATQKAEKVKAAAPQAVKDSPPATRKQVPTIQPQVIETDYSMEEPNPEPTTETDSVISPKHNQKHINDVVEGSDSEVLQVLQQELPTAEAAAKVVTKEAQEAT
mmetsp:Transcript_9577/g.13584  ORF Transcript_9577/g.13584 Transcript_9577/m.13584 type:complete len:307 (-) Transcript_9577:7-927(-)